MKNQVYTVTQLNRYIKDMFDQDYLLSRICVTGEVSNCKYHTSGHIYFTVKDAGGQIACVMFAGQRNGLAFQMKEGQKVVVCGSISVYERDGKYQMYAREIYEDGTGQLYQKYEALKKKLEAEGIFDASVKKKLPVFPKTVGIVTAGTGAALQDIVNIAGRRNPCVQLVLYPAQVQGAGAAASVAEGIRRLEAYGADVLIVGRGGGSIEDLWAFNEEEVARAIYNCSIPVISAVGHETDVTIADFAADLRAPTPSAAAELAVPSLEAVKNELLGIHRRLTVRMQTELSKYSSYLKQLQMKLELRSPERKLSAGRQYLADLETALLYRMEQRMQNSKHLLAIYAEKLNGLSPLNKLSSGYAYVTGEDGRAVRSIAEVREGDRLDIALLDGRVKAAVCEPPASYQGNFSEQ